MVAKHLLDLEFLEIAAWVEVQAAVELADEEAGTGCGTR
jgi:hypothetical protein